MKIEGILDLRKVVRDETRRALRELGILPKETRLPFVSDLTADDGMTDYGKCEDYAFLLSDALHRKYRAVLPKYDCWWWHLTPWTCNPSLANNVRLSTASGALYGNVARNARGAVSGLLFNPAIFTPAESECDSIAQAETERE